MLTAKKTNNFFINENTIFEIKGGRSDERPPEYILEMLYLGDNT